MEGTLTVAKAPAPTPTDPDPTDPSAPEAVTPVAPSLDVSAANKQGVKKLRATIVSDSDATLALAGKARIPTKGAG